MSYRGMSIKSLLILIVGGMAVLLVGLSSDALLNAGERYRAMDRIARLTSANLGVFKVLIGARLERGVIVPAMVADAPIAASARASLLQSRAGSDENYAAATRQLAALDVADLGEDIARFMHAHDAWTAHRTDMDSALGQAKAARDPALVRDTSKLGEDAQNSAAALEDRLEDMIQRIDPMVDQLLALKRWCWIVRNIGGATMLRIETSIAAGKPWSLAEIKASASDDGQVAVALGQMSVMAGRADLLPEIREKLAKAIDGYKTFIQTQQIDQIEALSTGKTLALDIPELHRAHIATVTPAADLAEHALVETVAWTTAQKAQAARSLVFNVGLLLAAVSFSIAGFAVASRRISGPIQKMTAAMQRLAAGELSTGVPGTKRLDEIGAMAAAVQVFKDSMLEARRLAEAETAAEAQKTARTDRIERLNREFDATASTAINALAAAALDLRGTAGGMTANSDDASRQAEAVSTAAAEASRTVNAVAAACEELASSIQEISRQIALSGTIAGQAVAEASDTGATMRTLSEAAQKIGDVVRLISDIASRTNLLALNATIEAARAGDAGKGFAVVASEVKSLATQTARATEEIAAQVTAMQTSTSEAGAAIARIDTTIARLNEIASSIAAAVQQQTTATGEIAVNVQSTAARTTNVSDSIGRLNGVVQETGSAATNVLGSADELGRQAEALRSRLEHFLADIRAA